MYGFQSDRHTYRYSALEEKSVPFDSREEAFVEMLDRRFDVGEVLFLTENGVRVALTRMEKKIYDIVMYVNECYEDKCVI